MSKYRPIAKISNGWKGHPTSLTVVSLSLSQTSPGFYVSAVKVCRKKKTVGKGEIARDERFLLFPQCFLPIRRTFCHFHPI